MKLFFGLAQELSLGLLLFSSGILINPYSAADIFELPKLIGLLCFTALFVIAQIFDVLSINKEEFKKIPRPPRAFWLLALLLFGEVLAYLFSTNPRVSLIGAPFRFQGLLTQIHYLVLMAATFFFFSRAKQDQIRRVFLWLKGGVIVSCILALLPYFFTLPIFEPSFFYDRVYGAFGNPNYLAVFLITSLPLFLFGHQESRLGKILNATGFILTAGTIVFTGSRGAILASLISFFIWGIFEARKKRYAMLVASSSIVVILITIVTVGTLSSLKILDRFSLKPEHLTSVQTRFELWGSGLKLFAARPITGYGQDAIKDHIEAFLPERLKANEVFFIDRLHNEYLDILVSQGILSFMGFIGFCTAILWQGFKICSAVPAPKIPLPNAMSNLEPAAFFAFLTLLIFYAMNFSTITSGILFSFLAGYLLSLPSVQKRV